MRTFTLAVVLSLVAACSAEKTPAPAPGPTFTPERFRAHVAFLADDLLEGRDTGSRGHEIAARYVAAEFDSYGLEPGGTDGSWFQQVPFQKTTRGADKGAITIAGPNGERRYKHGDNVMIGVSARETKVDLTAPLVFAGYGVEDERLGLHDYEGLDVKDCVVVVLRGYPKGLPTEEGAHISATKGKVAQKHGALGVLTIATLQFEKVFPWDKMLEYSNDPDFDWVEADGKPHSEAPLLRAGGALNAPAAEALFAGAARSFADVRAEADKDKGAPKGFPLKTRVRIQGENVGERVTSPNVVAILPGSDPELSKEYIVLSAHLDHLGIKDVPNAKPGDDRIYNGAMDNGAGIATLLEVARAAAAATDKPRRSMIFLATTAEEKGLVGADYYAQNPTVPIRQIVGNVDLDMPLLTYEFTDVVAFGANHSNIAKFVEQAVAPMNVKLMADPMPEQGIFTRSDHYQFVRQGVPAVFLMTGYANGGEKAWEDFQSGYYHTPRDDMSQKIDWKAGAKFAEANYRITRAMADSKTPPLWYSGDYFGDVFAPKAARAQR
ncbi:MAG TPA: M28 family metallopeptidase [Steroidobacteraceae bacterium]